MNRLKIISTILVLMSFSSACGQIQSQESLPYAASSVNVTINCDQQPPKNASLAHLGEYELRCRYKDATPQYYRAAFDQLYRVWGYAEKPSEQVIRDELMGRYGLFFEDDGAHNDGLPLGLNQTYAVYRRPITDEEGNLRIYQMMRQGGGTGLSLNCLICHASSLPAKGSDQNQISMGIPNVFLDMQRLHDDLKRLENSEPGLLIQRNPRRNSVVNSADYFGVVSSYLRRDFPKIDVRNEMFHLFTRSNPFNEHVEKLAELSFQQPYLKTQPWTSYKYKLPYGFYVDGGFTGNPALVTYRLAFSLRADGSDFISHAERFADVGPAYFSTLEGPEYPFPIDQRLAEIGSRVYETNCQRCHGTFEKTNEGYKLVNYRGLVRNVGTDRQRYEYFTKHLPNSEVLPNTIKGLEIKYNDGYMAPPLIGIWARAPYLHNGSVPSIRQLVGKPTDRVRRYGFRAATTADNYDQVNLGWQHFDLASSDVETLLTEDPYLRVYDPEWTINEKWLDDAACGNDARQLKDQSLARRCQEPMQVLGLSNQGHDLLKMNGRYPSNDEVDALIEFLKSI